MKNLSEQMTNLSHL